MHFSNLKPKIMENIKIGFMLFIGAVVLLVFIINTVKLTKRYIKRCKRLNKTRWQR